MLHVGQDQIQVCELLSALVAIVMLGSISGLSVPGLLHEYWLVEGDQSEVVFKLNILINATAFTLNTGFESADSSFKQICEIFSLARNAQTYLMVILKERVIAVKENMRVCVATISVQVICNTPSADEDDCGTEAKYNVTIKIFNNVSYRK